MNHDNNHDNITASDVRRLAASARQKDFPLVQVSATFADWINVLGFIDGWLENQEDLLRDLSADLGPEDPETKEVQAGLNAAFRVVEAIGQGMARARGDKS